MLRLVLVLVGNTSWALSQWYLVWLFARFAGGVVAVGEYASLLAVASPAFILAQLGLRTVYLTLASTVAWRVYMGIRLFGIAIASITSWFLLSFTGSTDPRLMGSLLILKCADSMVDLYMGRLQRQEQFVMMGSVAFGNALTTALAATLVVRLTGSIAAALIASASASAGAAVLAARRGATDGALDGMTGLPSTWLVVRSGLPVSLSQGIAVLATYLPTLLLAAWAGPRAVGIYAVAAYLLTAVNLVGVSFQTVFLTTLRATYETAGGRQLYERGSRIAKRLLAVGALGLVPVWLWGGRVVAAIYGPSFAMERYELALLAVAAIAVMPSYLYSVILVVHNEYGAELRIWVSAVVLALSAGVGAHSVGVSPQLVGFLVAAVLTWVRLAGVWLAAGISCLGKESRVWASAF